ncbi:MAG: hypothetical protein JO210_19340, partial [Acidobacteriaceae bacterium]|nr:hypothetical protein [Acidobacteriaceae bacterium]
MFERISLIFAICTTTVIAQSFNPPVTTGQYNTNRTSANPNEAILNTSNANVSQFGKLFSWSVDGWVFAQPLYVPGVSINGVSEDVVYVATMHNSIYAFDADHPSTTPLWSVNLGASVKAPTANGCPSSGGTGPELGILSTPVIDQSTNTLYTVSASPSGISSTAPNGVGYIHFLHAIDLTTHAEKFGGPVQIQASVPGSGYDSQGGRVSLSTASADVQRVALLLANGTVYLAFGDCGPDQDPWHGWLLGYNATNIASQTVVFNSTPNGGQGGIWQSGRGLVVDSAGDIYFNTGNTTAYNSNDANVTTGNSTTDAAQGNYGMRFLQLTSAGQFVASYPPANYSTLNNNDLDFSSSGPVLMPGTNLFVTGGKDGVIYLFNSNNLATPVQSFQATGTSTCPYSGDGCDQIHDLAFWNNLLYVWGSNDNLRVYSFNPSTGKFGTTPSSQNTVYKTGYTPAALAVSADSTQSSTGVLWAITPNSILHAFNAANVASELWNSNQNPGRDALPSFPKFVEPTVANGRVYVATHSNQIAAYGLLSDFTISTSSTSVTVNRGSSTNLNIDLTSLGGSGSVALTVSSGLPAGATASFNPSSLSGSGTSVLTIGTTSSTPTGTYNLLVSGTRNGETRTASVSLVVTTPADTTAPQWSCCTYGYSGSSLVLTFSAWDTQSGLKSIVPVQVVGASISIPQFAAGTNSVVNFTATESGWSSYVKFQLTDVAGNISFIDPCWVSADREPGKPIPFFVKNLSPGEGIVTVMNANPGLKNLRIQVDNGANVGQIEVAGLKDGETRIVNILSLLPSSGSTVTITPLGKPGGSATLVFANV